MASTIVNKLQIGILLFSQKFDTLSMKHQSYYIILLIFASQSYGREDWLQAGGISRLVGRFWYAQPCPSLFEKTKSVRSPR